MSKLVHVIDVESGNLQSLRNAIEHLGYKVQLVRKPQELIDANPEKLILPGVGNYGHFVNELFSRGFEQPVKDYISSGKPIMGICVGQQALFSGSVESPLSGGLGYLPFKLSRFNNDNGKTVPQIGWNSITQDSPLFYGLDPYKRYYFVHSYAMILNPEIEAQLKRDGWSIAKAKYGDEEFIASLNKGNIFSTQFHPEKSGHAGLHVIDCFLKQTTSDPLPLYTDSQKKSLQNDYSNNGLTRRIIACLDVRTNDQGDLVVTKGDQYDVREKENGQDVRNLGKPVELAQKYYEQGADEITFLNITSFRDCPLKDTPMLDVLKLAAKTIFVPLTVGGGIKDIVDTDGTTVPAVEVANLYFRSGADKVSIGTDAVYAAEKFYESGGKCDGTTPIETISKAYGAQAVVISVDPKRVYVDDPAQTKNRCIETNFPDEQGRTWCWYQCTIKGGRETRDLGVWELTQACEKLGAGEVLLNCIDRDGSNAGYDLELINHVKEAVSIPVIASSGAGKPADFEQGFKETSADACLGAGLFHRGDYTVKDVKDYLLANGLKVRVDTN
ncbi:similar to Saccharomyces cerevisiae YBR248C HIS7 Imidazole glycerol phosphate synthase (glutamine amidotransferase:cyclase) [Maudiozyma saulgeensis]|uniref:Imidazole glycerol phosphate synthase hisHF n=1 Tax=Maudiozyma saulgeensis TaxID=1789683 RepID=A0A1X7RA87_9SACH|nr:similar to Saccharomyces cerevisiae YBR248C HIS7 Imidazole glycerol phosphate synthase (glutamine amidotransferase:cyclase) [Kazachstania saulgeensis]